MPPKQNYKKKVTKKPIFKKINSKNLVAKKRRTNLVSLIKEINIKESERKYIVKSVNTGILNHNQLYQFHLWGPTGTSLACLPSQGTNDAARIGDRILLEGFNVRCLFQIPGDRRTTTIQLFWVPHNSDQGDPSTDLQHNVTGSTLVDPLQMKRWPGAYRIGTYRVKPVDNMETTAAWTDATNSMPIYANFFIPIKKKVFFTADATIKPSNLKEYGTIVIAPYHIFSALATDNVVINANMNATCYFKDL
uniref:hypothetical protein n=1 Tax=Flavobacterium sp. TaxID=239 RepID=UPI00404A85E7